MKSTNNNKGRVKHMVIALHRDLGFFFAGIVLIYALSGLFMNHRDSINPNYTVEITEGQIPSSFPTAGNAPTDKDIEDFAEDISGGEKLIKHFFTKGNLKLLFKGGSSILVDFKAGTYTYEKVSRRFLVSDFVRLHYNPGSWWTWFSDAFAICLMIITLTGLFIVKGGKGLIGRGGILFVAGIVLPAIFLIFF